MLDLGGKVLVKHILPSSVMLDLGGKLLVKLCLALFYFKLDSVLQGCEAECLAPQIRMKSLSNLCASGLAQKRPLGSSEKRCGGGGGGEGRFSSCLGKIYRHFPLYGLTLKHCTHCKDQITQLLQPSPSKAA